MSDKKVIDSKYIKTFSIKTTEQINKKYLLKFLRTNILNSDIKISINDRFYYYYLPQINTYKVLIFESSSYDQFPEPFIFTQNYVDGYNLFITENYFVLFKDSRLVLYKEILSDILKEDIILFIEQTLKIKIDHIAIADKEKIDNLKQTYIYKNHKNFYDLYEDRSFKFFQTFLFIATIVFFYMFFIQIDKEPINKTDHSTMLQKEYKKLLSIYKINDKKTILELIEIFKEISLNDILIQSVIYKNKKLVVILSSEKKLNLFNYISKSKKKIAVKSIKYNKDKNYHQMDVEIVI